MPKGIRGSISATCHPDKPNHALGLCQNCYMVQRNRILNPNPEWYAKRDPNRTKYPCNRCGQVKKYPEEFFCQKWEVNGKSYPARCLACHRKLARKNYNELKNEIFVLLGDKCAWPDCEWTDRRALQVDHIAGGGSKERKTTGMHKLYRQIRDNPIGYQLLCANHNWIKRHLSNNESSGMVGRGGPKSNLKDLANKEIRICKHCNEPRQYPDNFCVTKTSNGTIWAGMCLPCNRVYQKEKGKIAKDQAFDVLGNQCSWDGCGITDRRVLQIDHKDGGGRKEALALHAGYQLHKRVINDPSPYQLLCANHNWIKKYSNANEHSPHGFGEAA